MIVPFSYFYLLTPKQFIYFTVLNAWKRMRRPSSLPKVQPTLHTSMAAVKCHILYQLLLTDIPRTLPAAQDSTPRRGCGNRAACQRYSRRSTRWWLPWSVTSLTTHFSSLISLELYLLHRTGRLEEDAATEKLAKDTADAPHVDGCRVVPRPHQYLWGSVVLGHHLLRHVLTLIWLFYPRQTKVADLIRQATTLHSKY